MRAAVFGNIGDSDSGLVGRYLDSHGFQLLEFPREYPRGWNSIAGIDLVLLLGSEWSVYSSGPRIQVQAESDFVLSAIQRGVPVFGICFGAQLISQIFGGTVSRALQPELGWCSINSPSFSEVLERKWFQWHYDVFTAPHGFKAVAANESGTQAMVSERVLAVQFHPEVTMEILERWSGGTGRTELLRSGVDVRQLLEDSISYLSESENSARKLLDWFINRVNSPKVND